MGRTISKPISIMEQERDALTKILSAMSADSYIICDSEAEFIPCPQVPKKNCRNCGANSFKVKGYDFKCEYCGTFDRIDTTVDNKSSVTELKHYQEYNSLNISQKEAVEQTYRLAEQSSIKIHELRSDWLMEYSDMFFVKIISASR